MNSAFGRVITGQIILVICCIFYLIWWSISYRPGVTVNRESGLNGILLLITAVSGLSGVALSVIGANGLPDVIEPKLNGAWIVAGGIAAYFILMAATYSAFHRPVTTELILITGWAVLELTVISALNAAQRMSDTGFWSMIAVIASAFAISMVLYVLYYRMEPMKAFYAAMVPLITEGVSMLVSLIMLMVG